MSAKGKSELSGCCRGVLVAATECNREPGGGGYLGELTCWGLKTGLCIEWALGGLKLEGVLGVWGICVSIEY